MDVTEIVRDYYNNTVEIEWNRITGRPEFLITTRFIDRYALPGYDVLDIGGGPGRYSLGLYFCSTGWRINLRVARMASAATRRSSSVDR